jgi:hypothetical protein
MLNELQLELKQESVRDMGNAMARMKARLQVTSPLFNDLLLLQSRFRQIERENQLGTIEAAAYQMQFVKVQKGFLGLVDRIHPSDLSLSQSADSPAPPSGTLDREYARNYPWYEKRPFWMKTFNQAHDPDGIFEAYEDEEWTARFTDGGYSLVNKMGPSLIRFVYLRIDGRDMAQTPMSLEVQLKEGDNGPWNGVGLIYAYNKQSGEYYTFVINNHKEYKFWLKQEKGFTNLVSGRSSHILPEDFNRLGLVKEKDHFFLFINDHFVREVKDSTLHAGDAGILASGIGHFFFDNLAFYEK